MNKYSIAIHFGCLCEKIREQLKTQGFNYPAGRDFWQSNADKISSLAVSGLLTATETSRARNRLLNQIVRYYNKTE